MFRCCFKRLYIFYVIYCIQVYSANNTTSRRIVWKIYFNSNSDSNMDEINDKNRVFLRKSRNVSK